MKKPACLGPTQLHGRLPDSHDSWKAEENLWLSTDSVSTVTTQNCKNMTQPTPISNQNKMILTCAATFVVRYETQWCQTIDTIVHLPLLSIKRWILLTLMILSLLQQVEALLILRNISTTVGWIGTTFYPDINGSVMMKSNDSDDLNVAISTTVAFTFGVVRETPPLALFFFFVNHCWSVIK